MIKFHTDVQVKAVNLETSTEIKMFDMVRHDWSLVSKEVGRRFWT